MARADTAKVAEEKAAAAAAAAAIPASSSPHAVEAQQASEVAASVAAAQAAIQAELQLPPELLERIARWEKEQAAAEGEWRLKQSRMHLEFEDRKRRLQEQQLGQRKKLRETCDAALRPLYASGAQVCADLERFLVGRLCRVCG